MCVELASGPAPIDIDRNPPKRDGSISDTASGFVVIAKKAGSLRYHFSEQFEPAVQYYKVGPGCLCKSETGRLDQPVILSLLRQFCAELSESFVILASLFQGFRESADGLWVGKPFIFQFSVGRHKILILPHIVGAIKHGAYSIV